MIFVITNLDSNGFFKSATACSVDDLLCALSVMKCGITKYTLSKVKDFACCSLDLYYSNKKYKFFVRKVML